jgi:hypothetical protein
MDVGNFVRHLCELVLRHQMRVSNYFVNSCYSVSLIISITFTSLFFETLTEHPLKVCQVLASWYLNNFVK